MTQALTYVEIDVPALGMSPPIATMFRFAVDTSYLPLDIDAIPSIKEVRVTPATISLGSDLGQRASVTVRFKDHRHIFASEAFDSGTFWGKWRAYYGLKLRGSAMRLIIGTTDQSLSEMETRHYVVESTDGPSDDGEYTIVAKDILKLADGDRAQAPVLSNGFLSANISASGDSPPNSPPTTVVTLSPTGVGSEYPASGYVAVGGSEICGFTRSGDVFTLTRGEFNTTAVTHNAQDRVQLCLLYSGMDVANIIYDLFTTYAGVDTGFITLSNWTTETSAYLNTVYTALIAEPVSVNTLISELVEQAGLAIWWDDVNEEIRLQVLRPISTQSVVYDQDNTIAGTLNISEQPEKRVSQIYFYFAKINPLVKEDQIDNYRSSAVTMDADSETDYNGPAIKKIFSRWVPTGGRAVATKASTNIIGRFRDPPRSFKFDLLRYSVDDPSLGGGYFLGGWPLQDTDGSLVEVPIQVVQVNPQAEKFTVQAEEMLFTQQAVQSPDAPHVIIFDGNVNNVNLRTVHDSIYATPVSGTVVTVVVQSGIKIGSSNTSVPSFDVGSWPAGVTIGITNNGKIEGKGGQGGNGAVFPVSQATAGLGGGTALYTRYAISLTNNSEVSGGGGGGGGGGLTPGLFDGGGGGGGAGIEVGLGGNGSSGGGSNGVAGNPGTETAGGTGGQAQGGSSGGNGGNPGTAGSSGVTSSTPGGAAGAAGNAVDGTSFVTYLVAGTRNGPLIN